MARCGERSISRRIISAQFRSMYIIRVRCVRSYKSNRLFLRILAMAIFFLKHAKITIYKSTDSSCKLIELKEQNRARPSGLYNIHFVLPKIIFYPILCLRKK